MKKQQFILKLKKERIYSERIVEIGEGVLKYFKQNEPNVSRFTADLSDISFYEKYRGDPIKYKVYLSSKTNSFPIIRFKSLTTNDINPLLLFKNSLDNFINSTKRVKKDEIVMRINKVNTNLTDKGEDNQSEQTPNLINQSRFRRALTKVSKIQDINPKDFKTAIETYLPNFPKFKTGEGKYQHLLKSEYKLVSNDLSEDIVTYTTDLSSLHNKLLSGSGSRLTPLKEHFESFIKFSDRRKITYELLIKFFNILLVIFFIVSLYYKNYVTILFVFVVYSILMYEFSDFSFKNISFNNKDITDSLVSDQLDKSTNETLVLKSESMVGINIFTLFNFLCEEENFSLWNDYSLDSSQNNSNYQNDFEIDQISQEYFYNIAENKIIMTRNKNSEILNLYIFESNQAMTKTKITFISVMKKEYPPYYFQSSMNAINNFLSFVKFQMINKLHFDETNKISELEVYSLLDLEKESKLNIPVENINSQNKEGETVKQIENILIEEEENTQKDIPNNSENNFPLFKPFTNLIKVTEEFMQESQKLITTLNTQTEDLAVSDKYISDLLSDSSKHIFINLDFLSHPEPFNGRVSLNSNNNIQDSDSLIKQCLVKNDKKKIYRAKIKINQSKQFVFNYILNTQNKINFNKHLKDGVVIIQNETSGSSIQFQVYDFKILSKMRHFLLIETKRELSIGDKTIFVNSLNSINSSFLAKHENSERGVIKSSGYLVFDGEIISECYLGFWIECEISSEESLQDHALKEYLNHLKSVRDNINFDSLK